MAVRFRFRLEGLLKLRKALEEDAQRFLAKTIEGRNTVESRLRHLEQAHRNTVSSRRIERGEAVDLERWRAIERYLVVLEHRISDANADLAEAEQRVREARKILTRAHQAHLMLLRLKERRQEQHTHESLREEFREADELSVLRFRFSTIQPPAVMAREVSP